MHISKNCTNRPLDETKSIENRISYRLVALISFNSSIFDLSKKSKNENKYIINRSLLFRMFVHFLGPLWPESSGMGPSSHLPSEEGFTPLFISPRGPPPPNNIDYFRAPALSKNTSGCRMSGKKSILGGS